MRTFKTELAKCKHFLLKNGATLIDKNHYDFEGYGIQFKDNEIVFISDEGDFMNFPINYYMLLGYMVHMSFLGIGVKRA